MASYDIRENIDAYDLYYEMYSHWFDEIDMPMTLEESKQLVDGFDIYGIYCDNVIIGCVFFHKLEDGWCFHIAVLPENRGRWAVYWKYLKYWMLARYKTVYTATHIADNVNSKLIAKAGAEYLHTDNYFNWWKLWP